MRHNRQGSLRQMVAGDPSLEYLLVETRDEMSNQQYPLGVFERPLTESDLEQFVEEVDRRYRAWDPGLRSQIVYTGDKVSTELADRARRRGVQLFTFVEYQGLIDFGHYLKHQKEWLESDQVYPSGLYVKQRMTARLGAGATILQEKSHDDAVEAAALADGR